MWCEFRSCTVGWYIALSSRQIEPIMQLSDFWGYVSWLIQNSASTVVARSFRFIHMIEDHPRMISYQTHHTLGAQYSFANTWIRDSAKMNATCRRSRLFTSIVFRWYRLQVCNLHLHWSCSWHWGRHNCRITKIVAKHSCTVLSVQDNGTVASASECEIL